MIITFWPGVGTWEVLQFALQRKLPVMNDWKSPFVASIYWLSDDLFKSTGPILLVQQALFWSGLAMLAESIFRRVWQQMLFILAIAALPPIWITEIMLWKEAWTLSFLTLGMGATLAFLRKNRTIFAIIALLSAILLTATRPNALPLALPTLYLIAQTFAGKTSRAGKNQRRLIIGVVFAIFIGATLGVNWMLNHRGKQRCHIWHHALLWDLAAISLVEKKMLIPDEFRKSGQAGSMARVQQYFTYYNSDPLFFNHNSPLKLHGTAWTSCAERPPLGTLVKSWRNAIIAYPGTYLHHRLLYLVHLLGIPDMSENWWGRRYYRIDSEFTPKANRSDRFEHIRRSPIYEFLAAGIPLRGWFYLVVFLLSALGRSSKTSRSDAYLWGLWLAGCVYLVSFLAIGSGAVMRYLVVYVVLGPTILAGRWMAPTSPESGSSR